MSRHDDCPVRWCDQPDGHDGLHTKHIVALVAARPRGATIGLRLESPNGTPWPVVSVGDGDVVSVVLDWPQCTDLAQELILARGAYERGEQS